MKPEERKHRLALTLLFSGIVFCFLIITTAVVGGIIVFLIRRGILSPNGEAPRSVPLFLTMMIASILIGVVLTAITSRIPLKPVNDVINAMNRLAAGDYRTRLHFGKLLGRHPTAVEVSRSFNNLAEELEKNVIFRTDFINNFSHEFKTPITSIAGFARLLKRGDLTEEQKAEYIDIIEKEALRLSAMATNILTLTKVENQAALTGVSSYNLSEQIRNCVLLLENKWSKKNITPVLDFGEHYISANEEMLGQVWINLIDNAVKYGDEGTEMIIDIAENEKRISVSVADTGVEIPPEAKEKIFRKFYRESKFSSTEGNGLGLAIVKEIVRLHNGDITVSSSNRKTVFTVSLPK
ncbi:alkaline phosphatase synthesis sensor protein PhoR [Thermoclostridium stercorarium subsp. stercorarium DSM 8532]|jgi:signal transduction histidine kinase|uniref:Heme sensor protein HssS n=3 Tax=Thermoclostridium stercorarium TaxID=1510 RepID=L7VRB4_THES1|nr:HAMP domain-containing sensor histidine kinase [Thermoclostridium stercorarium]AGC68946.1 alkaline phosphatase synthesis sensor protein PhoR [Thermoclostridium stercorarium subsp. stercorarium DSM 8532]AGI39929.1 histidine kinase [Thermoclostridium stercorarium subsp. stercorarium DSM 8532]ANW99249.1 two-component sensor histidine kinase [Thermoclostridium stercorarium subsp. thermolacticum DSM 2910]ANX01877.1 two-component sensor histidine kinase [Thermoclostridium stercorarium subsp. lepto